MIEETRAEDKIFLTGKGEGLADAVEMVQVLVDRVVCDSYDFKQPRIATYIANGRLDSLTRPGLSITKRSVTYALKRNIFIIGLLVLA